MVTNRKESIKIIKDLIDVTSKVSLEINNKKYCTDVQLRSEATPQIESGVMQHVNEYILLCALISSENDYRNM